MGKALQTVMRRANVDEGLARSLLNIKEIIVPEKHITGLVGVTSKPVFDSENMCSAPWAVASEPRKKHNLFHYLTRIRKIGSHPLERYAASMSKEDGPKKPPRCRFCNTAFDSRMRVMTRDP